MANLTHFNEQGDAHMVDVGEKNTTHRIAVASGFISMQPETLQMINQGTAKKGDVLGIARIAGIMAAKKTADLIPLCHPIALDHIHIDFEQFPQENAIQCIAIAEIHAKTGVEMEALTAVQIALLTIYDMCKAVDRSMQINRVHLQKKSGGKSGDFEFGN